MKEDCKHIFGAIRYSHPSDNSFPLVGCEICGHDFIFYQKSKTELFCYGLEDKGKFDYMTGALVIDNKNA